MTGTPAWDPQTVRAWIDDDPDPTTAAELRTLLDAAQRGDEDAARDLADRFTGLLQFGTAGLRGALGGGPNRMNRAVVIRAAAGLGAYLRDELADAGLPPRVVVGYDARHRSADFARDSAAVLTAAGLDVLLMPRPLPTPVLAFAVRDLSADAGIMVTASHNPAADNGYKVYLGGRAVVGPGQGAQIVPPMDAAIASRIAAVPSAASVPRADAGWTVLDESVVDAYVVAVGALVPDDEAAYARASALRVVLTPMHGVGGAVARRVLAEAGFPVTLVPRQAEPDPDFPTVAFPNPEEPGALDLALALARETGADLVVALDPDADRCAVAVVDPHTGDWRQLHGDEVGALLGADAAARATTGTLAASIVSSRLLSRIAAAHGLAFAATLTGFKWISRTDGLVFGYEEALGYCVAPDLVRDKDGISAALLVATLAARLKAQGRGLVDELDAIARRHGLYLTGQVAARFDDEPERIAAVVDRLRTAAPTSLAGSPVTSVTDLSAGVDGLLPTDGFRLFTAADDRVVVRPSGTEPKVKCYLEVVVPLAADASDEAVAAARATAHIRLTALASDVRSALGLPSDS
jgi:phosphomannomutase